jgi:dTDP-4-dehydrorhamnose 3,5-epimerase
LKIIETKIKNLHILESELFADDRGSFSRMYCHNILKEIVSKPIAQINLSFTTKKGTVRGLHMQTEPHQETKIIKCLSGSVFDVAVDMREGSETFLQWNSVTLTSNDNRAYLIPEGFAHGFQALEDNTQLLYLHTNYYSKNDEFGFLFNDPIIGINWPLKPKGLSERDKAHSMISKDFKGF